VFARLSGRYLTQRQTETLTEDAVDTRPADTKSLGDLGVSNALRTHRQHFIDQRLFSV